MRHPENERRRGRQSAVVPDFIADSMDREVVSKVTIMPQV
jgi:hypothetical protein